MPVDDAADLPRVREDDVDRRLAGEDQIRNDGLVGRLVVKDDADALAGEYLGCAAILLQDQLLRNGRLRVHKHLADGAFLGDVAPVNDRDPVADGVDDLHLVRDDDDRHAKLPVDLCQQLEDLAGRRGVERGGRLVAQQIARAGGQRSGDGDALLLAARELRGIRAGALGKSDELQKLQRTLFCLRAGRSGQLQREQHVPQHRPLLEQVEVLKDHPDRTPRLQKLLLRQRREVAAVQQDLSGGRLLQKVDAAHQRGLARAGQADDAEDLAVVDIQADILQRGDGVGRAGVVGFAQMLQFDHETFPFHKKRLEANTLPALRNHRNAFTITRT